MKRQVTLITLIVLLMLPNVAHALYSCDYSTLSQLKAYATNINTTYDYSMINNTPKFTITISNVYKTMILYDNTNNKYYYPDTKKDLSDFVIGGYDSGKSYQYSIYTTEKNCTGKALYTFYVTLPPYNAYYNDPLCKGHEDYSLCKKWTNTGINYYQFKQYMNSYIDIVNEKEKSNTNDTNTPAWLQFYLKYYFIILPAIILVCGGVIYNYYKNDDFDF